MDETSAELQIAITELKTEKYETIIVPKSQNRLKLILHHPVYLF